MATFRNGAFENHRDETEILTDQDQTLKKNLLTDDENMGATSNSLGALEDEPDDFMQGDIDVKEQMDRAETAMENSIHGIATAAFEDSPRSEMGDSFRSTPGGLEEVEMVLDRELAKHRHKH